MATLDYHYDENGEADGFLLDDNMFINADNLFIKDEDGDFVDINSLINKTAPTYDELYSFYNYFKDLYGQGLEIAHWHLNGDLEPFDNFFEDAVGGFSEE